MENAPKKHRRHISPPQAIAIFIASAAIVVMIAVNLPNKQNKSIPASLSSSESTILDKESTNSNEPLPYASSWGDLFANGLNAWTTWHGSKQNPTSTEGVFSIVDHEGGSALRINGEIPCTLVSKKSYHNYHFSTKFQLDGPNLRDDSGKFPDSGILIHASGKQRNANEPWMTSVEYQLTTGRFSGAWFRRTEGKVPIVPDPSKPNSYRFDPDGELKNIASFAKPLAKNWIKPSGWNTAEVFAIGSTVVFKLNGKVSMVVKELRNNEDHNQRLLTSGKIVLQSTRGAFLFRDIQIKRIKKFPTEIERILEFAD